jgi:DNA-binding HxlR family transcriptional regulator
MRNITCIGSTGIATGVYRVTERKFEREFFEARPLKPDLGVVGHKWAMLILADIGLRDITRFNRLLDSNPRLTPRVLSRRLRELEAAGMITSSAKERATFWFLTEKGRDILPALIRLVAFGARWNTSNVFRGRLPKRV